MTGAEMIALNLIEKRNRQKTGGVTISKIAKACGVSYKHVYMIINGGARPSLVLHTKMMEYLGAGKKDKADMLSAWHDMMMERAS